jgi:heme/copper-type cytochrome/quinol oxidase subunit 2
LYYGSKGSRLLKGWDSSEMNRLAGIAVLALFFLSSLAYAHGDRPGHIDEQGTGLPQWITIVMVVSWITVAAVMVYFVIRLIRKGGSKTPIEEEKKEA